MKMNVKKTEQVPIPLLGTSQNNVKPRNKKKTIIEPFRLSLLPHG